ncbi:hypothetical protein [Nostoc sp. FACHB-110]|uniref:hypothetical protein n=1 Tax=Nostoc sp. FACHB-110 TaxID=2692834 RepID=UPI001683BE95|nr:hypothetical protein [Nostoc sp. FACHB-110]MBD2438825.1 hypothetical protein [Nostoc sp. FACHB-110]
MNLPFDLVETVHDVNGQPFSVNTTEADVFCSLPANLKQILCDAHFENYLDDPEINDYVLGILHKFQSLGIAEYLPDNNCWILTSKGSVMRQEIFGF